MRGKLAHGMQGRLRAAGLVRLTRHAAGCAKVAILSGARILFLMMLALVALVTGVLLLFRFVDPPVSSLMVQQWLAGVSITQRWVPLEQISPHLISAVIMSEDGEFCGHAGIDFHEMEIAFDRAERHGADGARGASTISMQVAKNLFLWPSKTYLRKGLELVMTVAMEQVWPKWRILEVYLNIAEWGPGVFGAEAAARYHFGKPPLRLTEREAALLAVALPNPVEREAGNPGPGTRRLAQAIERRMRTVGRRADCMARRLRGGDG
jgi:monofunctional biosynthetic peptidoglycan transglycosylase